MSDDASDADPRPDSGDGGWSGDWDNGEGGREPTRLARAVAAVLAMAFLAVAALLGAYVVAFDAMLGAHRPGLEG